MKQTSLVRLAWAFVAIHVAVSVFGLVGIAIMIPNPDIWSSTPALVAAFPVSVQWGGNIQIITGTGAMLAYGLYALGTRATVVFFIVSVLISLTLELTGTGFGWPFGAYSYTGLLGYQILDQVPPSVPLSWFFMGLASFVLAKVIMKRWTGKASLWPSVAIGAVLLAAWDLVLDPAMSHGSLMLQYWIWEDTGPYLGMPLVNILGWLATGALFMSVASMLDKTVANGEMESITLPLTLYLVNMLFPIGICIGTGLWLPVVLGLALVAITLVAVLRPVSFARVSRGEV